MEVQGAVVLAYKKVNINNINNKTETSKHRDTFSNKFEEEDLVSYLHLHAVMCISPHTYKCVHRHKSFSLLLSPPPSLCVCVSHTYIQKY